MFGLLSAVALATAAPAPEPMLDADCREHAAAGAPIKAGGGVDLYIRETRDHVWICLTAPPESFATADVELDTATLGKPINLHASAQLGEWDPADESTLLKTSTDERWWKISGWTGNTNHFRPAGNGQRLEFFPTAARELQIGKARFGRGEWRIRLKINGLKNAEGTRGGLSWPADGSAYTLKVE